MKKTILLIIFLICLKISYAQSGNLDSAFGINGIVKTDLGTSYNYGLTGKQVLLQGDGSIYTVLQSGGQTLISKKHLNGSADSSYGNNGFSVSVVLFAVSAAFQSDEKIVVVGYRTNNNNSSVFDYFIIRYDADGTIDQSFAINGTQPVYFPLASIAIQNDKKIVVAGSIADSSNSYFALARYNVDGNLDSSFSDDGKQRTGFGFAKPSDMNGDYPEIDYGYAVAVQNDGKIIVSGTALNNESGDTEFATARFNANGAPDSSFNTNGRQTTDFGSLENYAYSIAFQSDGKIVIAGYSNTDGSNYDLAVVRYNTNGSLDDTFSEDGKQTTAISSLDHYINNAVIQNDDKILIEGTSWNGANNDFAIVRYNANGSLDKTFSDNGTLITDFRGDDDYASSLSVGTDGKIIAVGYTWSGSNNELALARYNSDGSLDDTFDNDGKLAQGLNQGYTIYTSSAVQKDGKIIAAGYTSDGSNFDFVVARYNQNGSLDSTFGKGGKQITDFDSGNDFANSVVLQSDGKIVAAGYAQYAQQNTSYFALARYNTDGRLDSTFNGDGKQTTDFGFFAELGSSVAIQTDGKIVMSGSVFTTEYDSVDFAVARYNINGTLDNTFSNDGKQLTDLNSSYDFSSSVVIQTNGKIIVTGRSYSDMKNNFSLVRYDADGNLDHTFSGDGKQVSDFGTEDYFGQSAVLQSDGKILLAGYTQIENVSSSFALARYNTNGTSDTTFNDTGLKIRDFGSGFEVASSVAIQNNGKIIVAGGANGNFTLARYNTNGSADSTFSDDGIQITRASSGDDRIQGITIVSDTLYAVGYGQYPATLGVVSKYLLNDSIAVAPTVSLTAPADNATFIAPVNLQLTATAADADGTISKVEFYSGSNLLYTDTIAPYDFVWKRTPAGSYTLTAKATDNSGLATISAPVHVIVVPNKAPIVNIINPVNNRTFAAPAYIHFEAAATDSDGRIIRVEFYSASTLLATEYKPPYKFVWKNLPVGIYAVTAVATDNFGTQTTSAPVTVKVKAFNPSIVSSKPNAETNVFNAKTAISIKAWPNPANKTLTISANGLQQNRPTTISILSATGVIIKTLRVNNSTTQLDVSSLTSGVYTIKLLSGDKVLYKQFVKL